jgi:hypothetical protein
MPDQVFEEVEDLGLDGHQGASAVQFPAIRVECAVAEEIPQGPSPQTAVASSRPTLTQPGSTKYQASLKSKTRHSESDFAHLLVPCLCVVTRRETMKLLISLLGTGLWLFSAPERLSPNRSS